jgi:NAD(P)-dependent dehydrogenase (short-subunit alcohol dehydrogenase family)
VELKDTTALVTGAASGLGAATVDALLARGAAVVGIDLPSSIEQAPSKDRLTYVAADVTKEDEVRAALDAVGNGVLRLAVNCAGIGPARRILSSKGTHDLATFQRTIDINLVGTFNVMRLAAEKMCEKSGDENGQRGLIINTASVAAFEGQIGQIAYSASKGGVAAMTIVAARDLARSGIRVNTIAPGIVDTPMLATVADDYRARLAAGVPFPGRLARPDEFAQLVMMLAEHDYINGETVRMDGALRMAPQ